MEKSIIEGYYKLLPPGILAVVKKHMNSIDNATADYLCEELDLFSQKVHTEAKKNSTIDVYLIKRMIDCFKKLLKSFPQMSETDRLIISSAVRYFIDTEDAQCDFKDPFGFDDDLAVLNAALISTGREKMVVSR